MEQRQLSSRRSEGLTPVGGGTTPTSSEPKDSVGEDPQERYHVSCILYRFQTLCMKQNKNLQKSKTKYKFAKLEKTKNIFLLSFV
jgi:hypothetical protein